MIGRRIGKLNDKYKVKYCSKDNIAFTNDNNSSKDDSEMFSGVATFLPSPSASLIASSTPLSIGTSFPSTTSFSVSYRASLAGMPGRRPPDEGLDGSSPHLCGT